MSEFLLDTRREERIGFGEAIFCAGKTPSQIDAIIDDAAARTLSLLLTRLAPEAAALLSYRPVLDYDPLSRTAWFGSAASARTGRVAVVTAGTSDLPVAGEAARTLAFHGFAPAAISDIGVAGLWRLLSRLDELRRHDVLVVVAGMDAALPTVLGGLVPGVIIAAPTSVGYGVATGGRTALDAMLASCAPGVTVVNIDNGYGAACAAMRVLNLLARSEENADGPT